MLRIRIAGPQICKSQLCQQTGVSFADTAATGNQDAEILAGLMHQLYKMYSNGYGNRQTLFIYSLLFLNPLRNLLFQLIL